MATEPTFRGQHVMVRMMRRQSILVGCRTQRILYFEYAQLAL